MTDQPRIWITYAWADEDEGDFSYLVQELARCGVQARYDKIALVPGQRLWEQIGKEILDGDYAGWAYLLTPNSIASEACREELAYALYRALNDKDAAFPLIGLLHQVAIESVPAALKVRLCVSMADPNWCEMVKAGAEVQPPGGRDQPRTRYVWSFREQASGGLLVEVRPRFGELMYWRFAVPADSEVMSWGHGPARGGIVSGTQVNVVEGGVGDLNGQPITWFGSGDRLSPGVSAYVELATRPALIAFGTSDSPFGPPGEMEVMAP